MNEKRDARSVEAEFEIIDIKETEYESPAEGPRLTRMTIRKRYRGVIDGTGVAEVLTAQGEGGGGYVASERLDGTLDARSGTFVIQHNGVADGAEQSSSGNIVPNSGTGELASIAGQAMEKQYQVLTLIYTL
ncbi:MAG: DUF3224 domain-containing protein [Stackebrandtia sp.]